MFYLFVFFRKFQENQVLLLHGFKEFFLVVLFFNSVVQGCSGLSKNYSPNKILRSSVYARVHRVHKSFLLAKTENSVFPPAHMPLKQIGRGLSSLKPLSHHIGQLPINKSHAGPFWNQLSNGISRAKSFRFRTAWPTAEKKRHLESMKLRSHSCAKE